MEITEEELRRRLNSRGNLANLSKTSSKVEQSGDAVAGDAVPTEIPTSPENIETSPIDHKSTKRTYAPGISKEQRILAGILANYESAPRVARDLGLTRNQVYHAARTEQPKISAPREATLGRVQELALDKMMTALGLMSPEKFSCENPSLKDLSLIAKNMSAVVGNTSTKESESKIQIVVYSPETKKESQYKIVDV